jgi:hypothetical protein
VYLLYNEGYSASSGEQLRRPDLTAEAIRLAELLVELLPAEPEATGLLALMLLQESRRETRTDDAGELVLLELQDRDRWDQAMIQRGSALVEASLSSGSFGAYALQAAIAAVHAEAPTAAATDWSEIVGLYDALLALAPGPVVRSDPCRRGGADRRGCAGCVASHVARRGPAPLAKRRMVGSCDGRRARIGACRAAPICERPCRGCLDECGRQS